MSINSALISLSTLEQTLAQMAAEAARETPAHESKAFAPAPLPSPVVPSPSFPAFSTSTPATTTLPQATWTAPTSYPTTFSPSAYSNAAITTFQDSVDRHIAQMNQLVAMNAWRNSMMQTAWMGVPMMPPMNWAMPRFY